MLNKTCETDLQVQDATVNYVMICCGVDKCGWRREEQADDDNDAVLRRRMGMGIPSNGTNELEANVSVEEQRRYQAKRWKEVKC